MQAQAQPLTLQPVQVDALLLDCYGLTAVSQRRFDSELASVHRIELAGGRRVALKAIRHSPDALALTQWRVAAMGHLQRLGVPAGATILTRDGAEVAVADTAAGRTIVHLGDWLEGVPLAEAAPTAETRRAVGAAAARVAAALADWPRPPAPAAHPWELTRTLDSIAVSLGQIDGETAGETDGETDEAARALVTAAAERFERRVQPRLDELPWAVVHHDLHDANLLMDPATQAVTGVLDFGDTVWAPRIAELAIAAAYACRSADDPAAAYLDVAAGWGRTVPLLPEEIDVLLDASIGRLGVNLAVWSARFGGERGEYARARSEPTARTLRALLTADAAAMAAQLRERLL